MKAINRLTRTTIILIMFSITCSASWAEEDISFSLQDSVSKARDDHNMIGIAGAVASGKSGLLDQAVAGIPRIGSEEHIPLDAAWHIGSNTKMITAAGYALMVERGLARWEMTLPELFPDMAEEMDAGWSDVTIEDLLSHRSGLASNPGPLWFISSVFDERPLTTQRRDLARKTLSRPPEGKRSEFVYSNLGFILVGAAMEGLAQSDDTLSAGNPNPSYEDILPRLFTGVASEDALQFAFGPPAGPVEGHKEIGLLKKTMKPVGKGPGADNPAALGPAGTMNISPGAHALLLSELFLKQQDRFARLMQPYPDETSDYAFGMGVANDETLGTCYAHAGSNTMWLSYVKFCPEADIAIVVDTNRAGDTDMQGLKQVSSEVLRAVTETSDKNAFVRKQQ